MPAGNCGNTALVRWSQGAQQKDCCVHHALLFGLAVWQPMTFRFTSLGCANGLSIKAIPAVPFLEKAK
jgi:hypothetical protein